MIWLLGQISGGNIWSMFADFLEAIRDAGLTLNFEKCDFAKPEVKMVGHIVGSINQSINQLLQSRDQVAVELIHKGRNV